jgi:hypothetical protein
MVSGPAKIVEEGALEHINMLAKKYLGEDKYPCLVRPARRVARSSLVRARDANRPDRMVD